MMTAVHITAETWPPADGGFVVDARPLEGTDTLDALESRADVLAHLQEDDEVAALVDEATAAALALVTVYATHRHGPVPAPVRVAARRLVVALALADYIAHQVGVVGVTVETHVEDR